MRALPETRVCDICLLVVRTNTEYVLVRFSILVAHQLVFNGVENTEYDAVQAQKYADPCNVHSIIQKSFTNSSQQRASTCREDV